MKNRRDTDEGLVLGECHLSDFFVDHTLILEGVGTALRDISANASSGAGLGGVQISHSTLDMLARTVERALSDMDDAIKLANSQIKTRLASSALPVGKHEEKGNGKRIGPPSTPVVLSGAATGGVHVPQEVEDLGYELELLYRALSGMQEAAKDMETEPKHFNPALLFLQKIQRRVERVNGATDKVLSIGGMHPDHGSGTQPTLKKAEATARSRVPRGNGNGRKLAPTRA